MTGPEDPPQPGATGPAVPPPGSPEDGAATAAALQDLPRPQVVRTRRFGLSLVWLVPLVALLVAGSLFIRKVILVGPRIDIEFASAEGIEPGKTDVRYKEVVVGKVETVQLRGDRKRVIVTVRLDRAAAGLAVEDSLFWVVRPRIGTAGISGLGTLLSGAYIAIDAGTSKESRDSFVGLEVPPFVLRGEPGASFALRADDLGSLEVGSPVLYKRTRVGRVVGYTLDPAVDELSIRIFIEAPYQTLVTPQARFWNASGIDLQVNASGLTVNTESVASLIAGGIAFEIPAGVAKGAAAPPGSTFVLYRDRRAALAPEDGSPVPVRMVFDQSVRGLSEDAPIDFLGVEIGRVRAIALQYDGKQQRFPVRVLADIYPLRLGAVHAALFNGVQGEPAAEAAVLQRLVEKGMRAQLRSGNLLTGQLYVALDFDAKHPRVVSSLTDGAVDLPTIPGTLSEVQPQIADIVQKLSKVPFDEIGRSLDSTLKGAQSAISQLTPEAQRALAEVQRTLQSAQTALQGLDRSLQGFDRNVTDPSAPLQRSLDDTLQELQRAARSLRVLSDYIQLHPESLLRGKPADPGVSGKPKTP
jgi:paraquat-inducible protein B